MTYAAKLLAAGLVLLCVSGLTVASVWFAGTGDTPPPAWAKHVGVAGIALVLAAIFLWPGPSASGTFR